MPRPAADRATDVAIDRVLRGFARVGAVAVAAVGFALRTRSGRRTADRLSEGLAQADRYVARHNARLEAIAGRGEALLDRLLRRWRF